MGLAAIIGCTRPHAAVDDRPLTEEEHVRKSTLSEAEQQAIQQAFRELADGQEVRHPPAPAPLGVRWTDVPDAARSAATMAEMTVVVAEQANDLWEFRLKTIEGWPAELHVRRTGDESVYEVVAASVGRFGNTATYERRAGELVQAFNEQMLLWGAKRRMQPSASSATSE